MIIQKRGHSRQISHRATVCSLYLWGFFTLPALRNSFWGVLPPTVGQSFLLAGSSLADIDGPTSVAIWANCWFGDNSTDLPTSPSFFASSTLFSNSLWVGGVSTSGTGEVYQCWGFLIFSMYLCPCSYMEGPLSFPHPWYFLHYSHTGIGKRKSANQKPEQSHGNLVATILNL